MERAVWIGLVTLEPATGAETLWAENFGEAAGSFTTAVALASSGEQFESAVAVCLSKVGAEPVEFEDVETLDERRANVRDGSLHEDLVQALRAQGEPQFTAMHSYGPDEFESSADWLDAQSGRDDLTDTQGKVARELASMIRAVQGLDAGMSLEVEDGKLTITFAHEETDDSGVAVSVDGDGEIVVDYGIGHTHFHPDAAAQEPRQDAYAFIYAALQGGVKVEVWERSDGAIDRTRTLILLEGGTWEPVSAHASTPSPPFKVAPTYTKLLSFVSPSS